MKKFASSKTKLLMLLLCTLLNACSGTFVPDPIDPRLPKYTEDGNNVAGAFINDGVWESIVSSMPFTGASNRPSLTTWQEEDSLVLRFEGDIASTSAAVEFHLQGLNIQSFDDLLQLSGRKISLDGLENAAIYMTYPYGEAESYLKGNGQIYFKQVSMYESVANTAGETHKIIVISGTFGFTVYNGDKLVYKVSSGRFDYRLTEDSNFRFGIEMTDY